MIPISYITEWSEKAPWVENKYVEQDLIICRALVAIYSDEFLAEHLAFRGELHWVNCISRRSPDTLRT